jgi:hydroxylamine dehydrogenase
MKALGFESGRRWGLFVLIASVFAFVDLSVLGQQQDCIECHQPRSPKMVDAWRNSRHGQEGVGCVDCHSKDHSSIFFRKGRVSAATCAKCHQKEVTEFGRSLHASAVERLVSDPKFKKLSPVMREQGCMACHQIGKVFSDGSKGRCNSCHSGHSFSVQEALRPESCGSCHAGPDHPQMESWLASKHGQLHAAEETRSQAPTCVTCHMPRGNHDTGFGLTLGHVSTGAVMEGEDAPVKMRSIGKEEFKVNRRNMVETCLPCHSSRFANESLQMADAVKREADSVLADALKVIDGLQSDGLLRRGSFIEHAAPKSASGGDLDLGPDQLYDENSPIEQRFFDMFKFHHSTTFKGAYHHSPEYTHNHGFLKMKQDLTFIRNEAARLRRSLRED